MRQFVRLLLLLAGALSAGTRWAGGSGLNVIVVVNQNSTNSVQFGNDYCEQRAVPPQNAFRMTGWTNGAVQWSQADFETFLRNPLVISQPLPYARRKHVTGNRPLTTGGG